MRVFGIWARYASWSAGTCPPEKCAQVGAGAPPAPFVVAPAALKVPLDRLLTALFGWMLVVRSFWWEVAVLGGIRDFRLIAAEIREKQLEFTKKGGIHGNPWNSAEMPWTSAPMLEFSLFFIKKK